MKTQGFKNMYKVTYTNKQTNGKNVAFLNMGSLEEAKEYSLRKFGDNFISLETYLGVKR